MLPLPLLLLLLTGVDRSWSYPIYMERVPNGDGVPHPCKPNYLWRGLGHVNPLGGGPKNIFGDDFLRFGATWNERLCLHDSDGDGLTNGQELGDPNCVWTQGDLPTRTTNITHPGACDPWEGEQCPLYNVWVDCEADTFKCPAMENDPDTMNITFRFPPTVVPNTETNYMCMTFDLPGDDVYDLVGGEPAIDNVQVMHHMLLFSSDGAKDLSHMPTPVPCGMDSTIGSSIITGWTVGSPGFCSHEQVGYRFGKGLFTRVMLQIHWNNPELRGDYMDSSGMTVHYTRRLRPNSVAVLVVGQLEMSIPPRQPSVEVTSGCLSPCSRQLFSQPLYIISALSHMHYMGRSQKIELFRDGRLVSTITNDDNFSYDLPVVIHHNPPLQVLPGDDIKVTCIYNSMNRNETVHYGYSTTAEMCFGFLTVYPKEALPYTTFCVSYGEQSMCDHLNNNNANGGREGNGAQNANGGGGGSILFILFIIRLFS